MYDVELSFIAWALFVCELMDNPNFSASYHRTRYDSQEKLVAKMNDEEEEEEDDEEDAEHTRENRNFDGSCRAMTGQNGDIELRCLG